MSGWTDEERAHLESVGARALSETKMVPVEAAVTEGPERTYLVTWTVEVDAVSRFDAAEQALGMQQDPHSTATVFCVEIDGVQTMIDVDPSGTRVFGS